MRSDAAERRHAAAPDRRVDDQREVGQAAGDGRLVDVEDAVDAQAAGGALVGERGVEEAVGHDPAPGREGGADDALDQLGPRGGEEVGLGGQAQVPGLAVQDEPADALAQHRPARLAGERDAQAAALQGLGEQPGLGRLAAAVDALEGDEARRYQGPTRTAASTTVTARATHRTQPAHLAARCGLRGAQRISASSARREMTPARLGGSSGTVTGRTVAAGRPPPGQCERARGPSTIGRRDLAPHRRRRLHRLPHRPRVPRRRRRRRRARRPVNRLPRVRARWRPLRRGLGGGPGGRRRGAGRARRHGRRPPRGAEVRRRLGRRAAALLPRQRDRDAGAAGGRGRAAHRALPALVQQLLVRHPGERARGRGRPAARPRARTARPRS